MSASPSAGLLLDPQLQAEMSSPPAQQDPKPPPPAPQYIFAGTTYETSVDKDAPAPPPASTLEFSGVVPTSLPVQAEQATADSNHGEAQSSEPQQGSVPPPPVVVPVGAPVWPGCEVGAAPVPVVVSVPPVVVAGCVAVPDVPTSVAVVAPPVVLEASVPVLIPEVPAAVDGRIGPWAVTMIVGSSL